MKISRPAMPQRWRLITCAKQILSKLPHLNVAVAIEVDFVEQVKARGRRDADAQFVLNAVDEFLACDPGAKCEGSCTCCMA